MKILHVLAQLPSLTGSGVYFSNVIEGLEDKYEQAVIFGYQDDYEFHMVDKKHQYPVRFKTAEMNFPIVGMSDVMPYETTKYSDLTCDMIECWQESFRNKIMEAVEDFKPNLIICHHLWMLTSLVIDVVDEGIKIIAACHGTDIRQCKRNKDLKDEYVKNIYKLDKVFALSELHIPEIVEEYGIDKEKVVVMGGGFNQNIFYRDASIVKDEDSIDIIFAAKISEAKGVYQLIEAFPRVQNCYPEAQLHIVGSPDESAKIRLRKMIGPNDNISVYNVKNQKALGDLFRKSDIFVLPSYFEGLGLVAIESLACGMRVVSTEIDGLMGLLGEEVNSSGVIEYVSLPRLRNADEPYEEDLDDYRENLAAAIIRQIERHIAGEKISQDVVSLIDSHSWKEIVKSMEKEILEVLGKD